MRNMLIIGLFFSTPILFADVLTLNDIIGKAEALYQKGNNEANHILSEIVPEQSFNRRFPNLRSQRIENMTENDVAQQFKDCIFFTEGAYEDHLNEDEARIMSSEMATYILGLKEIELYRLNQSNIFNDDGQTPQCALAVKSKGYNGLLLMQGFFGTP